MCAIRFTKEFKIGNVSLFVFMQTKYTSYLFKVSVNANVVQSLTITMARIREVTTEMARLSREIGVRVISNV